MTAVGKVALCGGKQLKVSLPQYTKLLRDN